MTTCLLTSCTVRDQLSQHLDFLNSVQYSSFQSIIQRLASQSRSPMVRHAFMREFTPDCQALGKGAPFTGSAIYLGTDEAWNEGAWPLWTHIVRHMDGCLGCAGGRVVEPVDGHENTYLVYVGWGSIEKHEAYHHTETLCKKTGRAGVGQSRVPRISACQVRGLQESSKRKAMRFTATSTGKRLR